MLQMSGRRREEEEEKEEDKEDKEAEEVTDGPDARSPPPVLELTREEEGHDVRRKAEMRAIRRRPDHVVVLELAAGIVFCAPGGWMGNFMTHGRGLSWAALHPSPHSPGTAWHSCTRVAATTTARVEPQGTYCASGPPPLSP